MLLGGLCTKNISLNPAMVRRLNVHDVHPERPSIDATEDEKGGSSSKRHTMVGTIKDVIHTPKQSMIGAIKDTLQNNLFITLLVIAIIIGISIGLGVRYYYPKFRETERHLMYLAFPGKLLLRMLKSCIIPVIVTSVVSGIASIPKNNSSRLTFLTILYYFATTFLAVVVGVFLVSILRPGRAALGDERKAVEAMDSIDAFLDFVR